MYEEITCLFLREKNPYAIKLEFIHKKGSIYQSKANSPRNLNI